MYQKEYIKHVSTDRICIYCSMNEHNMKEMKNSKKAYLMKRSTTAMAGKRDNISTVQRTETKKVNLHC